MCFVLRLIWSRRGRDKTKGLQQYASRQAKMLQVLEHAELRVECSLWMLTVCKRMTWYGRKKGDRISVCSFMPCGRRLLQPVWCVIMCSCARKISHENLCFVFCPALLCNMDYSAIMSATVAAVMCGRMLLYACKMIMKCAHMYVVFMCMLSWCAQCVVAMCMCRRSRGSRW